MGYEVDFLPVASGGAAICVRWGTPDRYRTLVYDGGTAATGERLVAHVRRHYASSHVDYVVSSHPAGDHASGLAVVLRELEVGELWMHRPWLHATDCHPQQAARVLEEEALKRRIPVHEPFAGARIGPFTVLSPRRDWYTGSLLPAFSRCRGAVQDRVAPSAAETALRLLSLSGQWIRRLAGRRELPPGHATIAAESQSSAVLYGDFDGRGVLLTGCAGVQALEAAADCAELLGIDLQSTLRLLQMPNEGHSEHVSSRVLDRIVGARQARTVRRYTKSAFMSVALGGRASASRAVAQALIHRGALGFMTHGMGLHHSHEMPERGWHRARPVHWRR